MCKVNCCTHQIKFLYVLLDHQGWLCLRANCGCWGHWPLTCALSQTCHILYIIMLVAYVEYMLDIQCSPYPHFLYWVYLYFFFFTTVQCVFNHTMNMRWHTHAVLLKLNQSLPAKTFDFDRIGFWSFQSTRFDLRWLRLFGSLATKERCNWMWEDDKSPTKSELLNSLSSLPLKRWLHPLYNRSISNNALCLLEVLFDLTISPCLSWILEFTAWAQGGVSPAAALGIFPQKDVATRIGFLTCICGSSRHFCLSELPVCFWFVTWAAVPNGSSPTPLSAVWGEGSDQS